MYFFFIALFYNFMCDFYTISLFSYTILHSISFQMWFSEVILFEMWSFIYAICLFPYVNLHSICRFLFFSRVIIIKKIFLHNLSFLCDFCFT